MRKTKSAIFEVICNIAKRLHQAEAMDKATLQKFDRLALPFVESLEPEQAQGVNKAT